jgi:hypothetical protein
MLEPNIQPIHNGSRVRPIGQTDVISFEGFNKALSHAITLRALHWRRNRLQTQGASKGSCITRDVARPIIKKATPLHGEQSDSHQTDIQQLASSNLQQD